MPVALDEIERETGFNKDQLRKWRQRFGFPNPVSLGNNKTGFSRDTVNQLRLIRRMLDGGYRAGQVVGKTQQELQQLCDAMGTGEPPLCWNDLTQCMIERLQESDLAGLTDLLMQQRRGQSLMDFVQHTLAPLLCAVGEAWVRNEIDIHHEHLCTSLIERYLHAAVLSARPKPGYPTVLFALPPGEKHLLGLLMIESVLVDHGARTVFVGANIPPNNLKLAAISCKADVVALSFSFAYPAREATPTLQHLRRLLPEGIELWAGGAGLADIRRAPKGVRLLTSIDQAVAALDDLAAAPHTRDCAASV